MVDYYPPGWMEARDASMPAPAAAPVDLPRRPLPTLSPHPSDVLESCDGSAFADDPYITALSRLAGAPE